MNVLYKRRRRHVKIYIVIFAVCGLFFIGMQLMFAGAKAYKTWDELDFDSNLNMIYVTDVKPDLGGPYYEKYDDDDASMEWYYIWVDDTHIMPVILLEYDIIDLAHAYMDAKEKFQAGAMTEEAFQKYQFSGMGRLEDVSEFDRLDELTQYMEKDNETKGKNIQILPYSMQIITKDSFRLSFGIMMGFVLLCVISIAICIIRTSTCCGEKMLVEYRKEQGDTAALRQKLANFFQTKELVYQLWIDHEYIAGLYNTTVIFGETKHLIWAYSAVPETVTGDAASTIALSLTQTPAVLKVYFKNGKTYDLQMASLEDVNTVLQYIRSHFSWVTTEYSKEMLLKYKRKEYPF
ncbi:MAG: hypothetical protein K2L07_13760 [Lachnospiraceae bacterium]|nr:hypothetical protein [Lachnospiraceae bacterium]